jgi:hypothetical protein
MSTPVVDPILFSPHQNVRDQDAIEALIFMSSPGNSASLKRAYSPTASPQNTPRVSTGVRHALPTSQPRKSLPSHRPHPSKRVGFEMVGIAGSPDDMEVDIDSPQATSPQSFRNTPRRRAGTNGVNPGLRGQLSLPAALGGGLHRPRPTLADEDIERMLDRVAATEADSSDDDGEIQIPSGARGGRAGLVGS